MCVLFKRDNSLYRCDDFSKKNVKKKWNIIKNIIPFVLVAYFEVLSTELHSMKGVQNKCMTKAMHEKPSLNFTYLPPEIVGPSDH